MKVMKKVLIALVVVIAALIAFIMLCLKKSLAI